MARRRENLKFEQKEIVEEINKIKLEKAEDIEKLDFLVRRMVDSVRKDEENPKKALSIEPLEGYIQKKLIDKIVKPKLIKDFKEELKARKVSTINIIKIVRRIKKFENNSDIIDFKKKLMLLKNDVIEGKKSFLNKIVNIFKSKGLDSKTRAKLKTTLPAIKFVVNNFDKLDFGGSPTGENEFTFYSKDENFKEIVSGFGLNILKESTLADIFEEKEKKKKSKVEYLENTTEMKIDEDAETRPISYGNKKNPEAGESIIIGGEEPMDETLMEIDPEVGEETLIGEGESMAETEEGNPDGSGGKKEKPNREVKIVDNPDVNGEETIIGEGEGEETIIEERKPPIAETEEEKIR